MCFCWILYIALGILLQNVKYQMYYRLYTGSACTYSGKDCWERRQPTHDPGRWRGTENEWMNFPSLLHGPAWQCSCAQSEDKPCHVWSERTQIFSRFGLNWYADCTPGLLTQSALVESLPKKMEVGLNLHWDVQKAHTDVVTHVSTYFHLQVSGTKGSPIYFFLNSFPIVVKVMSPPPNIWYDLKCHF